MSVLYELVSTQIIPAQPGWMVVYELGGDYPAGGPTPTDLDPVIAWQIATYRQAGRSTGSYVGFAEQHSETRPVTSEGTIESIDWALVRPDGVVVVPGIGTHASFDDWIASVRERCKCEALKNG